MRTQVDLKQPVEQHASSSTNIPPVAKPSSAEPFIHDRLGVMMPHFEPTTGLESFCTLDQFIQQHVKAATGDPSPEVLVLQTTVDRLREARDQAVRDRHTLHGQHTDLIRAHNENIVRTQTLDTTIVAGKKEFEANMETIAGLRNGFKVEQDRANEARMKSEGDAAKLAQVMAELNDITTVSNHPGVLYTKLQAEVDVKSGSIKKLEKSVAEAEGVAKVERDLRQLAENTAAQKTRASEGLQQVINRLSTRVSELEKECDLHKTLKYDLAVAKSHLKNANTEVTRLREAQSGIMARSDEMRTKNDGLTERVTELEAEALLPMPSTLPVHSVGTGNATPLVDLPVQITLLQRELEKTRAELKQYQADNDQLESKITDLETQVTQSQTEVRESRTRNERLVDQVRDLKELISKYEAQIELPLPSQLATPTLTVGQQHSVIVCDLRLEVAKYKSDLEEVRAQLKQSQADLEEARFPWYGMVLEQEGKDGQGRKEAVDIVKAKIQALEANVTSLQSENGALQLQLEEIVAKAELKRLKDLALKNARETTKLQILHSGGAGLVDLTTPSPTSSPTFNATSSADDNDKMKVECKCGREAGIVEMALRSEVVFEQTLNLLENVKTAAQAKLDDSPLKNRGQRVRSVDVLTKYLEKVAGLVEHAREGVANRL